MSHGDILAVTRWPLVVTFAGQIECAQCRARQRIELAPGPITVDDIFLAVTSHIALYHNSDPAPL